MTTIFYYIVFKASLLKFIQIRYRMYTFKLKLERYFVKLLTLSLNTFQMARKFLILHSEWWGTHSVEISGAQKLQFWPFLRKFHIWKWKIPKFSKLKIRSYQKGHCFYQILTPKNCQSLVHVKSEWHCNFHTVEHWFIVP